MSSQFEKLTGYLRGLFGVDVSGNGISEVQHAVELELGDGLSGSYNELTKKLTLAAALTDDGFTVTHSTEAGPLVVTGITGMTEGNGIILTPTPGSVAVSVDPAAVVTNTGVGRRIDKAWVGTVPANLLADFNPTIGTYHLSGYRRIIAAGITGSDRAITLGVTGAVYGDTIEVVNAAESYSIHVLANSTLTSLPPGWGASVEYTFDGSVWRKSRGWTRPVQFGGGLYALTNRTIALCDSTASFSKFNRLMIELGANVSFTLRNGGAIAGDVLEICLPYNSSGYKATVVNAAGTALDIRNPTSVYHVASSRYLFDGTNWINWENTQSQPEPVLKAVISLSATTPTITSLWSSNGALNTSNVTLARTGVGVYTLTWPSGSFQARPWVPESSSSYYGLTVSTEQSANVVTIYASNGGNSNMTDTGTASITIYGE